MYFDIHSDLLWEVWRLRTQGEREVLSRRHRTRLREGRVSGLGLSIWAHPAKPGETYESVTEGLLRCAREDLEESASWLKVVSTGKDAERAWEEGKISAVLSVEGMAAIGDRLERIEEWYVPMGVRMAMLTWNEKNALGCGCRGGETGLTALGRRAISCLEGQNILLDVSHLNDRSTWEALDWAAKPVIASHSNCRALCPHPRNLTDEMLRAIAQSGGVVGLNACHEFVSDRAEDQCAATLAHHAAHMAEVMGVEHIVCGFDFCDFLDLDWQPLRGLEDTTKLPSFGEELARAGFSRREISMMARENMVRILG